MSASLKMEDANKDATTLMTATTVYVMKATPSFLQTFHVWVSLQYLHVFFNQNQCLETSEDFLIISAIDFI